MSMPSRGIVERLSTAFERTRSALESELVYVELNSDTELSSNWMVITASYCGLEQILKFLIAVERGLTIEELLDLTTEGANSTGKDSANRKSYRTHNLLELFSSLEPKTQIIIQEFYGRFQSLHSYIPVFNVEDFLTIVSGNRGHGYERWRYALIEEDDVPKNSPEALLAIWDACVQLAEEREWGYHEVQMPEKALKDKLTIYLRSCTQRISVEMQDVGKQLEDVSEELTDWLWNEGHPLNSFARVIRHYSKHGTHGVSDASEWFSRILDDWLLITLEDPAINRRTSLNQFVVAAAGHSPSGESIRWNPETNRFVAIPWSLTACSRAQPPKGAAKLDCRLPMSDRVLDSPLSSLWVKAAECGYSVLENRSFNGHIDEKVLWFRILQVQNEAGNPVLSIWQLGNQRLPLTNPPMSFFMEMHATSNEIKTPLNHWIDMMKLTTNP